ncbi:MAG: hypothetical protein DRH24_09185 [Deltaproteobacteria bacterium]|nr:MAG: hypothetical protein DRH24_09185 [Deltaproteobacteria bacterium]
MCPKEYQLNVQIENLLTEKKAVILKKWFELVIETYPSDTAIFIKREKDPFANPVGNAIYRALEPLFDELLNKMDHEIITSFLDPVIRIRAVQTMFTPSQATSFILFLKYIVREILNKEISKNNIYDQLLKFESKIDELCLAAFDIYVKCREKIYDIKANEERNKIYSAFARAGLIDESL